MHCAFTECLLEILRCHTNLSAYNAWDIYLRSLPQKNTHHQTARAKKLNRKYFLSFSDNRTYLTINLKKSISLHVPKLIMNLSGTL